MDGTGLEGSVVHKNTPNVDGTGLEGGVVHKNCPNVDGTGLEGGAVHKNTLIRGQNAPERPETKHTKQVGGT